MTGLQASKKNDALYSNKAHTKVADKAADEAATQAFSQVMKDWRHQSAEHNGDLWVFGYASLIWKQEFSFTERMPARVHGWHRALQMWSTLNRGTPKCPGLVFALLSGGSCQGVVFRIPVAQASQALEDLWFREMPGDVYEPRWLSCRTAQGHVSALAFTLPRSSISFCGPLKPAQYRQIFNQASGRYGTTRDYAQRTYESLLLEGIDDQALKRLLKWA
jgi:glutathione-specific gamma-glutamylcyclotransferase